MHKIKAFSLTEVMISLTIMTLIMLALTPMLDVSFKGISTFEARNTLKVANQSIVNRMGRNLTECQRFFERKESSPYGLLAQDFLSRVNLGDQPPPLTGSRLPVKQSTGTLSPRDPLYTPSHAGNCLFFTSLLAPEEVIVNPGPPAVNVRIDVVRFNYYYLSPGTGVQKPVGGIARRNLWEWHSIGFVDFGNLNAITSAVNRQNAIQELYNRGYRHAFDSSREDVASAFYDLAIIGGTWATVPNPNLSISKNNGGEMIQLLTGVAVRGFNYGVSPNTDSSFVSQVSVPKFSTVSGEFPSGFEVVIVGPNNRRQVFTRLVLIAEGNFKGIITDEQTLLTSVRDSW